VAFWVKSADDSIAELKRRDVAIVSEAHDVPKLGLRLAFFANPWDNLFEVIQAIDEWQSAVSSRSTGLEDIKS
jgi:hypothetical protein